VSYRTLNPATGELLESFPTAGDPDVERALRQSAAAFARWRATPLSERAQALLAAADRLERRSADLARSMAVEMGKPVTEGVAEARKCAWGCRYFAENAAALLAPQPRDSDGAEAHVRCDPLGPILAIMPWNFPFWQFFRFAAPALMAGNVALLKHAPNTPRCAIEIERLLLESGLPPGVVQNLRLTNEQAAAVIADRRTRGVTLTGSTRAGREVAAVAGRNLKPMVLELGGSDPFIVFEDADLGRAVQAAVAARCQNSGQSCIAAKRFLVQRQVFDAFRERFVTGMREQVMGDPTDAGVSLGPLARADLRERLARQVRESVAAGAKVLCGGEIPERAGFYYPATVLGEIVPGTPAADEELFGPVATLLPFAAEEDAVALANDGAYGLGASVWTSDLERARRLVPRIESGSVFVNGMVKSDPRLPFGGVKGSGFGRELGREGLLEFVNLKTVWFA
jgi:succinate-semialdehyde dehydrogenase/glutarate-semialdehyde dehydrogenase